MLPAETFEMRKCLLILILAKLRQNAEAVLKTYALFIYETKHVTYSLCKHVLKIATL
jgi:hypothetical protein